jgi:hypothetical protein
MCCCYEYTSVKITTYPRCYESDSHIGFELDEDQDPFQIVSKEWAYLTPQFVSVSMLFEMQWSLQKEFLKGFQSISFPLFY